MLVNCPNANDAFPKKGQTMFLQLEEKDEIIK